MDSEGKDDKDFEKEFEKHLEKQDTRARAIILLQRLMRGRAM